MNAQTERMKLLRSDLDFVLGQIDPMAGGSDAVQVGTCMLALERAIRECREALDPRCKERRT